mgnify:CR=1 FL=1
MERLDDVEPSQSFMFCILAGYPVKQYLGNFELCEESGETLIRWLSNLKPIIPLTGWIIAIVTKKIVHKILDQMEADHREDAA